MSFGKDNPTNPTNPSYGYGYDESGSSGSREQVTNPDFVWGPQAGYLQNLYGAGDRLMNQFSPYMNQANQLFEGASGAFNQMMNPGVNPQLDLYSREVGRNLGEQIMPQIRGDAAGFGQMGSSRHGVASGLATARAQEQVSDFATKSYNQDMQRMLSAAAMAPALGGFGMGIPWYALNQQSGLLGRPTVLGGGGYASGSESSFGSGEKWSWGGGGGGGGGGFDIGSGFSWGL